MTAVEHEDDIDAIEHVCDNDRRWFEQHPRNWLRLRPALPGDCEVPVAPGRVPMVLVLQLRPDVRIRYFIEMDRDEANAQHTMRGLRHLLALFWHKNPAAKQQATDSLAYLEQAEAQGLRPAP